MKKNKLILPLLFIAVFVMGAKTSDEVTRFGPKTGSDVTLQLGSGAIKWSDGSNKIQVSNDGVGFVSITDISANDALLVENTTIASSTAANALTLNLKISDGVSDPSGSSPAKTAFRDVTVTDGSYDIISATSALSIVVPSGATLGHADGVDQFVYVYELNNAGAIELAVSSALKDDSSLQTSVTIDGTSDDDGLYSTVGRSNVPIRLIARLKSNQVTAGTWALDVIENTPGAHIFTDVQNNLAVKMNMVSGDPTITKLAGTFTCSSSSSIINQIGSEIASIANISTGGCILTTTNNVTSWLGCSVTGTNTSTPSDNVVLAAFTTGNPGTARIDCADSNTNTPCTNYQVYMECSYRP